MRRWFGAQIREIQSDSALRWYGCALALVNAVTAAYWLVAHPLELVLDPHLPAVCWPFLPDCHSYRVISPGTVTTVVMALFAIAIANAGMFAVARSVTAAYWTLLILSGAKAVVILQDYRLILNQHYMAYWITVAYLALPNKRQHLRALIVLFYVWAGTLKINSDWLSGLGLYGRRPLGLPQELIPAACAYVVVLELAGSVWLFARTEWKFWTAFGQLILFHVASFWVVGFFYPLLMFLLLSIFPLVRHLGSPPRRTPGLSDVLGRPAISAASWGVTALFSLSQLVPLLFPGDTAVTGEGRMFALHMFDAPLDCRVTAVGRTRQGAQEPVDLRAPYITKRLECDPLVYLNLARDYCRRHPDNDLDLTLQSRRSSRASLTTVASISSVCSHDPGYRTLSHNAWIRCP